MGGRMKRRLFASVLMCTSLLVAPQSVWAASKKAPEEIAAEKSAKDAKRAADKAARDAAAESKKVTALRLAGPYEPDVVTFLEGKPPELKNHYRALFVEGERNAVLNLNRLGLAELQLGHLPSAKWAFDNALQRIESIYANDVAAKAARSTWAEEKVKDYKGEPYERAMAYYYRGLIYLMEGDYENARASFLSGEFQDTVSEREEFESDFALLNMLSGWASHCAGNEGLAKEQYAYARESTPALKGPAVTDNVLLVFEAGIGPVKVNSGKYGEVLEFKEGTRGASDGTAFTLTSSSESHRLNGLEATSISFQAMSRGGRPIQAVLNGKAQFKQVAGTVGTVGTTAGAGLIAAGAANNNTDMMYAGAGLALIGLLASAASDAAKPEADIRYWDMLPEGVDVATTTLASSSGLAGTAQAADEAGAPSGEPLPLTFRGDGKCTLGWGRQITNLPTASAPNAEYKGKPQKKLLEKDQRFRSFLLSEASAPATN